MHTDRAWPSWLVCTTGYVAWHVLFGMPWACDCRPSDHLALPRCQQQCAEFCCARRTLLQVAIKCNQLGVLYMNDAIPQHLLAPPAQQQQPLDFF